MAVAGVSRYARDERELADALEEATTPGPARDGMIAAGRELFAGDPADDVVELATATRARTRCSPRSRRRRGGGGCRSSPMSLAGLYLALTVGAHGVAALGVGVAKPPKSAADTVYLGVRVQESELRSDHVVDALSDLEATVVVDGRTAQRSGDLLQGLTSDGVDIANGGWGEGRTLRWNRAQDDCDKSWRVIAAHDGNEDPRIRARARASTRSTSTTAGRGTASSGWFEPT